MAEIDQITARVEALRARQPFRSFWVVLAGGKQVPVYEAQHALMDGGRLIIADGQSPIRLINASAIASVEENKILSDSELAMKDDLKRHLSRRPFEPFDIIFDDGSRYEVVRLGQAAVGYSQGLVVSADLKRRRQFKLRDIRAIAEPAGV